MDAFSMLLAGPRASEAFLLRSLLDPPWSLRIEDHAPITVMTVLAGSAVIASDTGASAELAPGDIALVRGPDPYTVSDDLRTRPQVLIHPDQSCTTLDGKTTMDLQFLDLRTWGKPGGGTVLLTGTYRMDSQLSAQLLTHLTPVAVVARDEVTGPVISLLEQEIAHGGAGQSVVLDRILDLMLITTMRAWFARNVEYTPRWILAYADRQIGRALQLMHNQPAEPWTVASLAAACDMSRAAFARRFTALVGTGPVGYLTEWRLSLAAELLADPGRTIAMIARTVGYSSPFALTTAFTRKYGRSPREYRGDPVETRADRPELLPRGG